MSVLALEPSADHNTRRCAKGCVHVRAGRGEVLLLLLLLLPGTESLCLAVQLFDQVHGLLIHLFQILHFRF